MNEVRIAIVGGAEEAEVQRLATSLKALKQNPVVIDTRGFPWVRHLTFSDGGWCYERSPLESIRAYFIRNLHCNPASAHSQDTQINQASVGIIMREKDSLLGSLLRIAAARGCMVLNTLDSLRCHFYKLDTLHRLRGAQIPVPATLATNDLETVKEFAQTYTDLIYKPLAGGAEAVALCAADLESVTLGQIRIAPVMIQERVYGEDVRAYVLGGEVIAAAALSTGHVDFRSGPQDFKPVNLTAAESAAVIASARVTSLDFASIDFKRSTKGEHVILDVNPAPMFAGFEKITGRDIGGPLASYLVAKAAL